MQESGDIAPAVEAGAPLHPLYDVEGLSRISREAPGFWSRAWRRFKANKVALVSLVITILIVIFALAAGLISEHITHHTYYTNNLKDKLLPPLSPNYILGTDGNGRDVLTRLAYGARVSLRVAVLAAAAILAIGGTIGAIAGFFGGKIDTVAMRAVDTLLSIPTLVLLILVSSFYRPGPTMLAFWIAAVSWAGIARLIRGEVMTLKNRDFIDAARVSGASSARILTRHILPNIIPIIVVWASLVIPGLILTEASLSYLGLGVRPPVPSWGNMLQDAKQFVRVSPWLVIIPGFMIYLTVLCVNLVGSGLRDALDPRLNQ